MTIDDWPANTDPNAGKVKLADGVADRAHPALTGIGPVGPDPDPSRSQVEFVDQEDEVGGFSVVERQQRLNCPSGPVHEGTRVDQRDWSEPGLALRHTEVPFARRLGQFEQRVKLLDRTDTRIMSVTGVVRARVAETDNEPGARERLQSALTELRESGHSALSVARRLRS